jgi:hypothetical protein
MIERITDAQPTAAPDAVAPNTGSKTLCHTPFGDVLVDELATPNLLGLCTAKPAVAAAPVHSLAAESVATVAPAAPAAPPAATTGARAPAVSTDPNAGPTAESLFGPDPFMKNPAGHGPNGKNWQYNPAYFATRHTADTIAKMIGGTVVERNAICPSGPMIQDQVNEMIVMPDGRELNAGLIADIFNHERCQSVVARMFLEETGVAL